MNKCAAALLGVVLLTSACGVGAQVEEADGGAGLTVNDDGVSAEGNGAELDVNDDGVSAKAGSAEVSVNDDGVSVGAGEGDDDFAPAPDASDPDTSEPDTNDPGKNVTINGDSQITEADCDGKAALISSDFSSVTLTGSCTSIQISGDSNIIYIDTAQEITVAGEFNNVESKMVGALVVEGESNTISYGAGLDGGTPDITNTSDYNSTSAD